MKSLFKTLLAAAMLAAAGFSASAQMSFQAGVTMPYQRQLRLDPLGLADRYGIGAYAGFDYDINIVKGFSITPGLYYNFTMACYYETVDNYYGDEIQKDHLINIPVHFKYEFNIKPDKFAIYLYAGPVLSIGAASSTNVSVNINLVQLDGIYDNYSGVLKDLKFPGSDRLTSAGEKQELMDAIQAELDAQGLTQRRFDLQFDWGVGFRFKGHWELRTGYSFGLIDRYNGTFTRNYNLMMNQYYIGFGYRF